MEFSRLGWWLFLRRLPAHLQKEKGHHQKIGGGHMAVTLIPQTREVCWEVEGDLDLARQTAVARDLFDALRRIKRWALFGRGGSIRRLRGNNLSWSIQETFGSAKA